MKFCTMSTNCNVRMRLNGVKAYSLALAYMLTAFLVAVAESRYFSSISWSSAVARKYSAALRGFTLSTNLHIRQTQYR